MVVTVMMVMMVVMFTMVVNGCVWLAMVATTSVPSGKGFSAFLRLLTLVAPSKCAPHPSCYISQRARALSSVRPNQSRVCVITEGR